MSFGACVQGTQRDDPNRPQGSVSSAPVGTVIEVYWPQDDAWYRGTVVEINPNVSTKATTSEKLVVCRGAVMHIQLHP